MGASLNQNAVSERNATAIGGIPTIDAQIAELDERLARWRARKDWVFGKDKHYLSPSALLRYLRCGECYELKYWDWQPTPTKVYFPQGAGLHEAIYWARYNSRDWGGYGLQDALDQARRGYAGNLLLDTDADGNPIRFDVNRETADILEMVRKAEECGDIRVEDGNGTVVKALDGMAAMLRWTEAVLPRLIEQEAAIGWKVLEADVDTAGHLPFPFRARIDAQLANNVINDVKSASKKEAPDWYTVFQMQLYALPLWQAGDPFGLEVSQVTKTKTPGLWRYTCEVTDQQMIDARNVLMQTAEDIHNGIFRRRPSRFCDYSHGLPKFVSVPEAT